MFAVVVTFKIAPDRMHAFMPLMLANARSSLTTEAGCHQFDVATDPARPNAVFLYELYRDRAAFDLHMESAHFLAFNTATAKMIDTKTVQTFAQVYQ